MKKRITISVIIGILSIIFSVVASFTFASEQKTILLVSEIVVIIYIAIFLFSGLSKLIIYFIYGIIPAVGIVFFGEYRIAFGVLGAMLFIINPLASFEKYLEKRLSEEDTLPIRISIHGSYWPFYAYRKAMKEYFHLPQTRKLYTKKSYLRLRQILTLLLLSLGIFLFIAFGIGDILENVEKFEINAIVSLYGSAILFILAFVLHKKGFISLFRALVVTMFPMVIFVIAMFDFPDFEFLKILFLCLTIAIALGISGYELYLFFRRVTYQSYSYRDLDKNWEVYANAIFEPLVYNETFTKIARISIPISKEKFESKFTDILIYANFYRFIITTYAYDSKSIIIYADFHHKATKRIMKFQKYLEKKFAGNVELLIIDDVNKKVYETNFFHKTEYIVARAVHLARLLKELEIESEIIISLIFYFESLEDLRKFQEDYYTVRLEHLEEEDYYTVRVDILSPNTDFIIEQKIREVLMDAMINRGNYVRVSVYY